MAQTPMFYWLSDGSLQINAGHVIVLDPEDVVRLSYFLERREAMLRERTIRTLSISHQIARELLNNPRSEQLFRLLAELAKSQREEVIPVENGK